jgi:hypothetical protein
VVDALVEEVAKATDQEKLKKWLEEISMRRLDDTRSEEVLSRV